MQKKGLGNLSYGISLFAVSFLIAADVIIVIQTGIIIIFYIYC